MAKEHDWSGFEPVEAVEHDWSGFEPVDDAQPRSRYGEYGDAPEDFSLHSTGVTREAVRRDLREANRLPSTEETSAARAEEVRNADRAEFGRQPSRDALEAGKGPMSVEGFARSGLADNRVRALRDTPSGPILPPPEAQVQQRLDDPAFARDDRRAFLEERAGRERSWAEAAQDAVKQIALGTVQISGAPASLFDPDSDIARRSAEVADNLQAQLTPTTRARLELATTRIAEAAENGRWDEAKAVWDEYMTDPVLAQHFVVSTLPSFAAVLGPAKVAQLLVMARGGSAAAATKAAALAAGGANATLTGGDARQNAYDDLLGTYLAAGMPHAEAKHRAREESRLVAAVGMGAGWLGGKYGVEASLFATRGGLSRATAALGVLAREIGTELNEEVTPLILTNSIAARTDGRDPFKDALATAGQTVVATGPVAAAGAGVTAVRRDPDLTEGMQWTVPADRVAVDALSPGNAQLVETPSARQQAQMELDALARQVVAQEAAEDPGSPVVTQARTIDEKRQEYAATALDDARRAGQGSDASRGAGDAPVVPGVERGDRAAARAPVGGGRADSPVGDAGRADPALGDPVDALIADIEGRQEPYVGDSMPSPVAATPAPMLMSNGKPFPSEKTAAESARQRRLDRVPVKVEGGWGLAQSAATPAAAVEQAERRTDPQPSDAQKEAGNYAKGKVTLHGQTVAIETPKGAERSGTDASGKRWSVTMPVSYGYFLGTKSSDGEHVDVFIGPNPESDQVWVVNQNRPDSQEFDEPKVMMGFDSAEAARRAYLESFADGFGARVDGGIVGPFPAAELEGRLAKMGRRKPVEGPDDPTKQGPFGPIFDGHTNDPEGAIDRLMSEKRGEVADAFLHPELGQVAFVYGDEKMGLRHIESKRGIKWVRRIPEILRNGRLERDPAGLQRAFIVQDGSPTEVAVIRLDWDSQQKTWLVTAHPDDEGKWSGAGKTSRTAGVQESVQGNPSRLNPQSQSTPDDGGSPAADAALDATPEQRIEDFGERIEGARKHYAEAYADAMREAFGLDIATEPLAKTWPAPDYDKLIANGVAPRAAALVHAMRDEIGSKPKARWKLQGWVGRVRELRDFSNDLLAGRISADDVAAEMERRLPQIAGRTALYEAVGHGQSLRGIGVTRGQYSVYDGVAHNPPRVVWTVERQAKATAFSNFPTRLASGETREEAIEAFRQRVASDEQIDEPASRQVSFDIYSYRGRPGVWIGKKLGRTTVDLKRFDSAAEARRWKADNQAELERMWAAAKDLPAERRDSNDARVGVDHRSGGDVTPESFAETFGFRGVQFGNYVENARRQQDLNDAYDALMDLAGVIGVPPRALSLNGELGLAFGARGKGGKRAPSAHYEPGQVVINLTKAKGAGSLAHEWFHALDNYFSRARGEQGSFVTANPNEASDGIRPEMVAAFRVVMDAIESTGLPQRSRVLDQRRRDDYWGTPEEAAARSFEAYVVTKLQDQEAANDYLANIVSAEYWEAATGLQMFPQNSYPYPLDSEMPAIRAAFDAFFDAVQTRETERGVELYSRADEELGSPEITSESDLVAAFRARFPRLAPALDVMLERGRANRPGGVVFVDAADPDAVAQEFASRTGRDQDAVAQVFRSEDGGVQGVYDPRSGLTFLVGPALTAESAPAVLLHEITHSQQRERIDARAMELLASRHRAARPVREFLDRVAERMEMAGEAGNPREAAAYIVEEAVLQGRDAGYEAVDSAFTAWIDRRFGRRVGDIVRSFVQMVRGWMHRHGLGAGSMTVDDLVGYAMAGVERAARGDVRMAAAAENAGASVSDLRLSMANRAVDVAGATLDRARDVTRSISQEGVGPTAVEAFSDLNAEQRKFLSKIGASRAPAADAIREALDRSGLKIRQGIIDRFAALKSLDENLHGKDFIDTAITDSSWVLARMSSAGSGALQAMMSSGRIAFDKTQRVITMRENDASSGLTAVLKQLGPPAEVERFFAWMAANRAENLMAEGREHLFTPNEIASGKSLNAGNTEDGRERSAVYAKAHREFQEYRDDVLAIAEATGIISTESREMWREEFYVPFYRVMAEEDSASGPRGSRGLSRQEAYKRLKGGRENLNDLLENTLLNFHHLLSASLKNQAATQAIRNAEKLGIARPVPESERDTKTSTFILEDGQRVFYEIEDAMVYEAITVLADPGLNNFAVRVMGSFKRLLTNTVTVTPQFIVANTLRDLMQATATTPTSKNVFRNLYQGTAAYRDQKTRAEMLASGGAFSFGHLYGVDASEVKANLRRSVRGAELVSSPRAVPGLVRKGWRAWGEFADTSENVSRAATYVQNLEHKGRLRASFEARDIMDFSAHGAWPAIRFLVRVVPFLNARLQGLDKIYRSGLKPAILTAMGKGTESDKIAAARFATVAGALTLATIALYLRNADDEEYQKLEEWQKDTYWFVRIGDNAFFIPKPFEVGAIATMAERIAQQFLDDKATGELFRSRMKDMFTQTFSFNPVPQAFQPMIDIYSNRDAFTGRQIETAGMERLSVGLRARDTTTAPARALSAASRVLGDESPVAISPVQADHLIRGYLGSVGASAAGIMDTMYRTAVGQDAPAKSWSEYQPIRRFYRDLGAPAPYTRYSTLFYDGLREANRVYADVIEMQKLGRQEDASRLMSAKAQLWAMRATLNRAQSLLSDINQRMQAVRRSDKDGAWKRRELDRMNTIKGVITERIGRRIEDIKAAE